MKYILSILAALTLFGAVGELVYAEQPLMQAYSVNTESAALPNSGSLTTSHKTNTSESSKKQPAPHKSTKKSAKKTSTKKSSKKTTDKVPPTAKAGKGAKPKKVTAKKSKAVKSNAGAVGTTATSVENADLGDDLTSDSGIDASNDSATEDTKIDKNSNKDSSSDVPEVSKGESKSSAAKGLAVAGGATASGLGLVFLIRKFFFH